ncbi:MAG: hypothetical protein HFE32_01545 [Clostridia bacterium]|nr:hypothetical protein [Clostridia bacterium]
MIRVISTKVVVVIMVHAKTLLAGEMDRSLTIVGLEHRAFVREILLIRG